MCLCVCVCVRGAGCAPDSVTACRTEITADSYHRCLVVLGPNIQRWLRGLVAALLSAELKVTPASAGDDVGLAAQFVAVVLFFSKHDIKKISFFVL